MPERQFITGIAGVKVHDIWEREAHFEIQAQAIISESTACPRCQAKWS